MLVIGSLVEVLQRFHALVPRARRQVAVIQNGLQQILAFRIASAQTTKNVSRAVCLVLSLTGLSVTRERENLLENLLAGRVSMMARAGQNQFHRLLELVDVWRGGRRFHARLCETSECVSGRKLLTPSFIIKDKLRSNYNPFSCKSFICLIRYFPTRWGKNKRTNHFFLFWERKTFVKTGITSSYIILFANVSLLWQIGKRKARALRIRNKLDVQDKSRRYYRGI